MEQQQLPRHWVGLEELNLDYWSNPQNLEKRGQEFFEKPIEAMAKIDATDSGGIARRDFLTLMGASMAMASMACARRPVHKIIPYVVQPADFTPGVPLWYASTNPETGSGILVKTREARPIKIEGNPDHLLNRGASTSRDQASVLSLYDPERLKEPIERGKEPKQTKRLSYSQADQTISARLAQMAKEKGRVRVLTGALLSPSTQRLIDEFLAGFSAGKHVEYAPLSFSDVREASEKSYGTSVVPAYRFQEAQVVVAISSDFMNDGLSPTEHMSDWAKLRKVRSSRADSQSMSKFYAFESVFSLTGANADERFAIRAGDELKIACALAHELIINHRLGRFAADSRVVTALSSYKPEAIANEIGLRGGVETLRKVSSELWKNRGKSLVIAGSAFSRSSDSLALQIVINLLNSTLENEGVTLDGTLNPDVRSQPSFSEIETLVNEMNAGGIDALLIYGTNPSYSLPTSLGFDEALKKVSLVIRVAELDDETSQFADFVLPSHHYLENWGDVQVRKHYWSVQQPTIAPLWPTRAFEDTLIEWSRQAKLSTRGLLATLGTGGWHEYLQANWKQTLYQNHKISSAFELFWESILRVGFFDGLSALGQKRTSVQARSFRSDALSLVPSYKADSSNEPRIAFYASSTLGDGQLANNAWLQECPDPVTTVTWDNYLAVSPALATRFHFSKNDVVEVKLAGQTFELPILIQPGMHPDTVSAAIGYGRTHAGKVGNGVGVNLFSKALVQSSRAIFSGMKVELKKTGKFYKLAETQWHHLTENRPVMNDITLAQFKTNPSEANHTNPHLKLETVPTIWPKFEYKGYRWGMAIDLNACTGCGACIVGCQAENNIPTVGREFVRKSREMHWIRIDRYYSGSPENPDVVFQPMLCQHCENAPCETVCPVLATVHDSEGMNSMIYNRCVGTRYCQNNCPYKVRRFNFFDHWKSYEGSQNLVWNPEVLVRSRGVMEKCTFCVQRVIEAKHHAKDRGDKVRDGEVQTACQQACPTEAIVFGNINDPETKVSKLHKEKHAFRSLEILNTRPAVSYLSKVRNKEHLASNHQGSGGGH